MSDEVREAKAGEAATVNENQEEQITKPAPKVKPQKEKDPKKVAAGKKLAEKNRQAKAALERELKREIAEREQENENSAGAEQRSKLGAPTSETSGNPVSSKIGMV